MAKLNGPVYVKLVCHQCYQKYSFDVLPVNDQMPVKVECPACRADGTPAANLFLAQKLKDAVAQPLAPRVPVVQRVPSIYEIPAVAEPHATDEEWRHRALQAEARAEQAQAALKASLTPQLAEFLKEAVVQGLAAQRSELLKVQQSAALEVSALAHRLDELKAPMLERLRSYQDRILELERTLAERNEENRELLKLKIEMTRRQMEAERASNRVDFN